ncbi:MAG: hypothetical protein V7647_3612 [Acidobacteriota bacterium]|jgi:tRNA threonylcarbamoyladenosine modification (KEOPS) complex Cgi121 subunit
MDLSELKADMNRAFEAGDRQLHDTLALIVSEGEKTRRCVFEENEKTRRHFDVVIRQIAAE